MLESLILSLLCASSTSALPPNACEELGIERGTVQDLPDVEFGASDSFMLTLDGKPRLVRLVPWSLRERGPAREETTAPDEPSVASRPGST